MIAAIAHPAEQLQEEVFGEVIFPGSERYNAARQAWNLTVDQHPALIVTATCAADVAAAVRYARNNELRVAVEEWLSRIPEFEVIDPATVTWAGGQVRGPRSVRVRVG